MLVQIQVRRGDAADWTTDNPILADGEEGLESDTGQRKVGNGVLAWNALPYYTIAPSDAGIAAAIDSGPLTDIALLDNDVATLTEKDRALRTWNVAALKADTVAVDIVYPTSDSIGAGAYAGALGKTFLQVALNRLRKALVPTSIVGGTGYYGFADNPILTGAGFIGATGTVTLRTTYGLGLKAYEMAPGATLSYYFVGTTAKLRYRKDPSFGNFTYTIDGGAPSSPVSATGASATAEVTIGPLTSALHTIVITAVGTVGVLGSFNMDGDETAGIRLTGGAHSGYGALEFTTTTTWTQDLALVANPKLFLLPLGSNDFYAGRTVAQARANLNTIIAAVRAAYGASISIVLISYYDRPAPSAVVPWTDYVQMYRDMAAADDWITLFDAGALFGPMTSTTDDRNGLTTALTGDYVHPTPEGHRLLGNALADFLTPSGAAGAQAPLVFPAEVLDAANHKQTYVDLGNFAGAAAFNAVPIGAYTLTATGNISVTAAAMFPVTAGKTAHAYVRIVQDATGSRTFTPGVGIKVPYPIVLQTAAGSIDMLHCFWDGAEWLIENIAYPGVPTQVTNAVLGATGDMEAEFLSASFSGPITLSGLSTNVYGAYRLVLTGAVSFSASAKPAGLIAGKAASFRIIFVQDGTGSRVMTWNANVLTAGGIDPVLSTAAGAIDLAEFFWTGSELILVNFVKGCA